MDPTVMATQRQPHETRTHLLFFDPLEPDGSNYLGWNIDMRAYLCVEEPQKYENHIRTDRSSQSSKITEKGICHKCGRKDHYAKEGHVDNLLRGKHKYKV
jgi:hypothetical protein